LLIYHSGTSDDEKALYGPKFIHILIMSKIRGVHGQYDTKGRRGTRLGPSQPKVGPAGQVLLHLQKTVFTTCQSKSIRGVSNVEKAVERLNLAARPSCMVGQPDKWISRAQSSVRAPHYSSYKYPHAPLEESVKKVRFSFL
jgi:hypothetical protein